MCDYVVEKSSTKAVMDAMWQHAKDKHPEYAEKMMAMPKAEQEKRKDDVRRKIIDSM